MKNKLIICILMFGSLFTFVMGSVFLFFTPNGQNNSSVQASSSQRTHVIYDISQDGTGNGTSPETPRLIGSIKTLRESLPTSSSGTVKYFVLISDIDLSSVTNWSRYTTAGAIGSSDVNRYLLSGGVFDGNNYSIIGLKIDQNSANRGFFHTVSGTVKDLYFENVSINETVTTKPSTVGVVASTTSGTAALPAVFNNVHVEGGRVVGANSVGGIVGSVVGTVTFTNCSNSAEINGISTSSPSAGGIAGSVTGTVTITDCSNNGDVNGQTNVGGIFGSVTSNVTITGCSNYAEITGANQTTSNAGGIVGSASGSAICKITGCFNGGVIIGQMNAGGILGSKTSTPTTATTITSCANEGSISVSIAPSGSNTTGGGGIVGNISGGTTTTNKIDISWCYSRGGLASGNKAPYLSGILGRLHQGAATVEKCFSDVEIATGGTPKTGIAGVSGGSITINGCYFNNSAADVVLCNTSYTSGGTASTGKSGAFLGSQEFIDLINLGQGTPVYVMIDGKVKLRELNDRKIFMFKDDNDINNIKVVHNYTDADNDEIFNFDDYAQLGFKKAGYTFVGWKEQKWTASGWQADDLAEYPSGRDSYPNEFDEYSTVGKNYVTFVAEYVLTAFAFDFMGDTSLSVSDDTFTIEDYSGVTLTALAAADFTPDKSFWRIKIAGKSEENDYNWETLGAQDTVELKDVFSESFIDKYAEYRSGAVADANAYFTVKLVTIGDDSSMTSIFVEVDSDMTNAGLLYMGVEGEDETRVAPFGSYFVFSGNAIELLKLKENDYYQFTKCEIFDENGSLGFISNLIKQADEFYYYNISDDLRFEGKAITGIKVYFEKKKYSFNVFAAEKDHDGSPLASSVISIDCESQEFSLDDTTDITLSVPKYSAGQEYIFYGWKIQTKNGFYNYISSELEYSEFTYAELANVDWLLKYLINDEEVIIIAEYFKQYNVVISISPECEDFGRLILTVMNSVSGSEQVPNNFYSGMLPEGSWVMIEANTNEHYEFDEFENFDVSEATQFGSLVFEVKKDRDIKAKFKYKTYKILFEFFDTDGNPIRNVSGVPTDRFVELNDVLALPEFELYIQGYYFEEYKILDTQSDEIENVFGNTIDADLLKRVLNGGDNFVITAIYKKFCELSFVIEGAVSENDYRITVYHKDTTDEITERELQYGEEIRIEIELISDKYFTISSIKGTYGVNENAYTTAEGNNAINITMQAHRKITVRFTAIQVSFEKDLTAKGSGKIEIDRITGLKVGQQITLIATPGSMQEIKKWKVNGVTVTSENLPSNFESIGNTLVITITSEWLGQLDFDTTNSKFVIDSTVEFGFETRIVTITMCTVGAIVLLAACVLLYTWNVRRNNARIKQELIKLNRIAATMGAGNFVADLKAGKDVGVVTKESIKEAKKQEKIRKREERIKNQEEKK